MSKKVLIVIEAGEIRERRHQCLVSPDMGGSASVISVIRKCFHSE
jgi:hypothetical protein